MSALLVGAAVVAIYLIVSFFALAVAMLALGAAFAAALEVVVYAGAILVLFVFVVMMIGPEGPASRARAPGLRGWIGPSILSLVLLGELAWALAAGGGSIAPPPGAASAAISPKAVGIALFGPYALCVEIAAFLLLSGLVGAYHLARPVAGDGGGGA
jgi:NADH-quinone oxidoreductase subunit J